MDAFEFLDDNLTIELWARSPLIYSPVAMNFDALGRLWLTEGIDYQRGLRIEAGRSILVLEDQDGEADSSHVFVTEKDLRHAPWVLQYLIIGSFFLPRLRSLFTPM